MLPRSPCELLTDLTILAESCSSEGSLLQLVLLLWPKIDRVLGTLAIYQRLVVAGGGFFLLLDLGPGAAACEMAIKINTEFSRNLAAARRQWTTVRSYSFEADNCQILVF